ncbi:MAG: hypothetical protein AAGN46_07805 [Acidobacteriota bacterium]
MSDPVWLDELERAVDRAVEALGQQRAETITLREEVATLEHRLNETREAHQALEQEFETLREEHDALRDELAGVRDDHAAVTEREAGLTERARLAEQRTEELTSRLEELELDGGSRPVEPADEATWREEREDIRRRVERLAEHLGDLLDGDRAADDESDPNDDAAEG